MKINRENYEEWLLDFIEGRLNAPDEVQVRDFLDKNPDIKTELEDLEAFVLEPTESNPFTEKVSLKKNTTEIEGLTRNDYLFIQKTEGTLSFAEKEEYGVLIKTDPGAGTEQELYNKTVLSPDDSVSFPHKMRLKRVAVLPFVTKDIFNKAAVAGIILLMATALWFNLSRDNPAILKVAKEQPVLTQQTTRGTASQKETVVPVPEKDIKQTAKAGGPPRAAVSAPLAEHVNATIPAQTKPALKELSGLDAGHVIKPVTLNGYEVALNQIMPLYLAYIRSKKEEPFTPATQMPAEKERKNVLLAGSVKMVNLMTGNSLRLRKKFNDRGDVVAYSFATPNLQIDHKVKK